MNFRKNCNIFSEKRAGKGSQWPFGKFSENSSVLPSGGFPKAKGKVLRSLADSFWALAKPTKLVNLVKSQEKEGKIQRMVQSILI